MSPRNKRAFAAYRNGAAAANNKAKMSQFLKPYESGRFQSKFLFLVFKVKEKKEVSFTCLYER